MTLHPSIGAHSLTCLQVVPATDDGVFVHVRETSDDGASWGAIRRLDGAGALDPGFGDGGVVRLDDWQITNTSSAVALEGGALLVAGSFFGPGVGGGVLYVLDGAGGPAPAFGGGVVTDGAYFDDVELLPDGSLAVVGYQDGADRLRHLLVDGSLDASFAMGGAAQIDSVDTPSYVMFGNGSVWTLAGTRSEVRRFTLDGTPVTSFGGDGYRFFDEDLAGAGAATLLAGTADGVVLAGTISHDTGSDAFVAVLGPDGQLDPAFGDGGRVVLDDEPEDSAVAAARMPDGDLVVVGATGSWSWDTDMVVWRLTSSGQVDSGFGKSGRMRYSPGVQTVSSFNDVAVDHQGRILTCGDVDYGPTLVLRIVP